MNVRISDEDLKTTAMKIFATIIARLRTMGPDGESKPVGQWESFIDFADYAASRVGLGVELQEAVLAVRLDFIVLWRALNRRAEGTQREALTERAEHVYTVVDEISQEVKEAFEAEIARRRSLEAASIQEALSRLFSASALRVAQLDDVAKTLRVESGGRFALIVVPTRYARALVGVAGEIDKGRWNFSGYAHGAFFLFWQVVESSPRPSGVIGMFKERNLHIVGVMDDAVQGLMQLRTLCRTFSSFVQGAGITVELGKPLLDKGGIVASKEILGTLWADVALKTAPEVVAKGVEALGEIDRGDLSKMVEVIDAFFETGSIKAVASRTFCHRNTVVNRLKAFERCTGLSPMIPRDCVFIVLILAQARDKDLLD